jgi:GDP-4-dehydro-6-deoxy-D-mannose reductase
VRVLLTGADGFVGGWLARRLLEAGHEVVGTRRAGGKPSAVLTSAEAARLSWRDLDLASRRSVEQAAEGNWDVVFHLAALASGSEARADPGLAWEINAAGTARLAEALAGQRPRSDPLLVLASTGEVYGPGTEAPRRESDPTRPCSPYAASKLGAEVAVSETARRAGIRVVIARAFPHTGPGQDLRFVVPSLVDRLVMARRVGAPAIKVGNVEVVRDFLDVRDVAAAYLVLAERGVPGEIYNVASGEGQTIAGISQRLMDLLGWTVTLETDARLVRSADIPYLVGDATRLRALGWSPRVTLDQTLRDLLDAQAH